MSCQFMSFFVFNEARNRIRGLKSENNEGKHANVNHQMLTLYFMHLNLETELQGLSDVKIKSYLSYTSKVCSVTEEAASTQEQLNKVIPKVFNHVSLVLLNKDKESASLSKKGIIYQFFIS